MPAFTINDLKKHLGTGLGLRKNRYIVEIPVPTVEGQTINLLCRSAGLPERNINTTTIWHKGRQYNVRGETDYIGSYEISILDDSDMKIRKLFDSWLRLVDDSKPANSGILGASFEQVLPGFLNELGDGIKFANQINNAIKNPSQILDFGISIFEGGASNSYYAPSYQTDINVWQVDNYDQKVYGYKLQNAFPKSVGIVTLDDGDENTLSEFSVVFAFSEFIPLENDITRARDTLLGDRPVDVLKGVESLFD